MTSRPPASLALVFAYSLAAQVTTVSASSANSPAPSSTAYPFGYSGPMRVQILYAASETGLAAPALFRALEVRANPVSTNAAKANVNLQISLSTSPLVRTTLTNTFANNHGTNVTIVYTRKPSAANATTPSFVGQGSGMLMFDTPFLYQPANGSLLVDFDVASQPSGAWSIDSAAASPTSGRHSTIGTGCNGMTLTSSGGGNAHSLTYTLSGGPANAQGAFLLGTNALPAPLPVPGSPGCFLYQDIAMVLGATLSGTGGASLPITYAANPQWRGFTLFGLAAALNVTAGRVDTSASRALTLTDAHDGGRVYVLGNNTTPTGTLQLGSMIVIRLQR
jgi:hypothetical protein